MAMNGDTLGTAIKNAVQALNIQAGTPITPNQIEDVWQAVSGQIVSHVQANAVVTVTGVQAGASQAGGTVQ